MEDDAVPLTKPPAGLSWRFSAPEKLEQCCRCGEPLLPGDSAMVIEHGGKTWWAHYDSRPCWKA